MRKLGLAVVVLAALWSLPAAANFVSYEKLYRARHVRTGIPADATKWGTCFGYLSAIADAFFEDQEVRGKKACLPPRIKMQKVWDDVLAWMEEHPGDLILNASTMVVRAMSEIYPCK